MSEIEELRKNIDELEEEIDGYEFGSFMYDHTNAEIEYAYLKLDKHEKKS